MTRPASPRAALSIIQCVSETQFDVCPKDKNAGFHKSIEIESDNPGEMNPSPTGPVGYFFVAMAAATLSKSRSTGDRAGWL